jgi:hypothetical protein
MYSVHPAPGVERLVGPRTQRGLRLEVWGGGGVPGGVLYLRKVCTCADNPKRRVSPPSTLADLPVTERPDGTYVLAF